MINKLVDKEHNLDQVDVVRTSLQSYSATPRSERRQRHPTYHGATPILSHAHSPPAYRQPRDCIGLDRGGDNDIKYTDVMQ